MIDPRLNDRGYSERQRAQLAADARLIAADHAQLWKDSDLARAATRNRPVAPATIYSSWQRPWSR